MENVNASYGAGLTNANPPQPPQKVPQQKSRAPIIKLLFAIIFALASAATYFGYENYLLRQQITQLTQTPSEEESVDQQEVADTSTPEPAVEIKPNPETGWTFQKNETCGVTIPVPPKQAPYLKNVGGIDNYWEYSQTQGGQVIQINFDSTSEVSVVGSEYADETAVKGRVTVHCANNETRQSSQAFADEMSAMYSRIQYAGSSPAVCESTQNPSTQWGQQAVRLKTECKSKTDSSKTITSWSEYIFTTPEKKYHITKSVGSMDRLIETEAIFSNIVFD